MSSYEMQQSPIVAPAVRVDIAPVPIPLSWMDITYHGDGVTRDLQAAHGGGCHTGVYFHRGDAVRYLATWWPRHRPA